MDRSIYLELAKLTRCRRTFIMYAKNFRRVLNR